MFFIYSYMHTIAIIICYMLLLYTLPIYNIIYIKQPSVLPVLVTGVVADESAISTGEDRMLQQ